MKVYIEIIKDNRNQPRYIFDGGYAAHEGACYKGYDVIFFEDIREVPASKDILVVACIESTILYFQRTLGIRVPEPIDWFKYLKVEGLITRDINYTTIGELLQKDLNQPIFLKSNRELKVFPSGVVKNPNKTTLNLLLGSYDHSTNIMTSSVENFVSEYRVFYRKDRGMVGMKHYSGNPCVFPNMNYVHQLTPYCLNLMNKTEELPVAYTADFGVCENGKTELIEYNDAWSVGAYGLDGEIYIDFLLARWKQLMK